MSKIIEIGSKNINLTSVSKQEENEKDENSYIKSDNKLKEEYEDEYIMNHIEEINKNTYEYTYENSILTPEETREKRKKIIFIQRYIQNFRNDLIEFEKINFTEKTIKELNNYIDEIRLIIGNKNSNNMVGLCFSQGLGVIESIAPYLNMDLSGLSIIALKDEAIRDCIKELSIELIEDMKYVKPHIRLGLLTGGLCFQLNNINKANNIINNYVDKPIKENIKNKYNDL